MRENQELIDKVLDQMAEDFENKDFTAIEELMGFYPRQTYEKNHLNRAIGFDECL